MVTRADVEKALWIQSAWQIEQEDVDRIMLVVDAYAESGEHPPPVAAAQTPPPATVLDLPLVERKRLLDRENEIAAEEFERGRLAGLLQADEERRAKSPERPSEGLDPLPGSPGPADGYKAFREATDMLWRALRLPPVPALDSVPAQRQSGEDFRRCNKCSILKPVGRFTRDPKGKDGLRGQCKDCEAEVRAARKRQPEAGEAA